MVSESSPLLPSRLKSWSHDSTASRQSSKSRDDEFAERHGMDQLQKTIGKVGSFILITNNIAGPGLMGLPLLYQQAGLIPVTVSILFICICASVTGALLSETIARVPGNAEYTMHLEYSGAFDIIMGKKWYWVAEAFFMLACMVQVFTGIVETAQSLDSFIASYLLGKTYALSVYPSLGFIEWTPSSCIQTVDDDCTTPFKSDNSAAIISLGYVITSLIFMPFGRGNLKETMTIQITSFLFLIVLLFEFDMEFILHKGLNYSVNWFGKGEYSQLIGVVLFNYAFAITIPAWLTEKTRDVSINATIWSASAFSSFLYISFGMLSAFAFSSCSESLLTQLASNEVSFITRISAAVFGLTIIGAGVPVFCVIIKNTLYSTGTCGAQMSFFIGSVLPYFSSWLLYKGDLLIDALNWAGLIVNGAAAFCLPLVLSWYYFSGRSRALSEVKQMVYFDNLVDYIESTFSSPSKHQRPQEEWIESNSFSPECDRAEVHIQSALPTCLIPYRSVIILCTIAIFSVMIVSTIVTDAVTGMSPS